MPIIRGLGQLIASLQDFEVYSNTCRGHTTLGGAVLAVIHRGEHWTRPEKSAKNVPAGLERRFFADVWITAYRLAAQ